MLQVGLIGLGPEWSRRFRPALERLRKRIAVRSVYATVGIQAEQAAAELDCDAAPGLVALMEREDIRAVLVLESDWHGDVPAWAACQLGSRPFSLVGWRAVCAIRDNKGVRNQIMTGRGPIGNLAPWDDHNE
jgi:hypothetical protein